MTDLVKDLNNPVSASKRGQEALQDILTGLRDFMLPFYGYMDLKKRSVLSTHQALHTTQQCDETLQQLRVNRERLKQAFVIVKESCDRLPETDPTALIPYKDQQIPIKEERPSSELTSLLDTREQAIARYLHVSEELNGVRKTLTEALWALNDLTDPIVVKQ